MSFDVSLLKAWRRHRWVSIALAAGYAVVGPLCLLLGHGGHPSVGAVLVLLPVASIVGAALYGIFLAELGNALFPYDRVAVADQLERNQAEAAELKRRLEIGDVAYSREEYLVRVKAWQKQVDEANANGTRPPPTPVPLSAPPEAGERARIPPQGGSGTVPVRRSE